MSSKMKIFDSDQKLKISDIKKKLRKILSKKARISYLEILILIISLFAFSYIIYSSSEIGIVKAETNSQTSYQYNQTLTQTTISNQSTNWNCCLEDKNNAICQDVPGSYQDCKTSLVPAKCQDVSSCKLGCCYDSSEGLCSSNSPKQKCEQEGGKWTDNKACNIADCKLGCCVLGSDAQFVTEKRCEKLSAFYGLQLDFKLEINDELGCLALSYSQARGACVIEGESDCKFTTKQECLQLTDATNFHENLLCTNPQLNTTCKKTENTICVEGKDEVYFKDSCGNIANIYDASKINNLDYWSKVYENNESCVGNANNPSCGNCNRFTGSFCGDGKAKYGKYICKDLNCKAAPALVDALGKVLQTKDRKNGESWCVYDSAIGEGKDVVGSRHFKYYCSDGEVKIESCSDYRQDVCVQNDVESSGESFSSASCRVNRWRECLDYNNLAEKQGEKINYDKVKEKCQENSDCYIKEFNFGEGYKFWQCLPQYPSGFDLNAGGREEINSKVCSMANFDCVKVEVKTLTGWDCVAGCECTSKSYTQQMNDWCTSLGDCGGKVNILGEGDDAYSVSGAPKIDLGKYKAYINPVEGEKAEPGKISELLIGQMGLELGPEGYVPEEATIGTAFKGFIGGKGIELAAFYGASLFTGPISPGTGVQNIISALETVGGAGAKAGATAILPPSQGFWVGFGNEMLGGIAGTIAGYLVVQMFGLQGQAATITMAVGSVAGAIGGMLYAAGAAANAAAAAAGAAALAAGPGATGLSGIAVAIGNFFGITGTGILPVLGVGGIIGLIAAVVVAIVMKVLGIGEIRETHAIFKCYPWEAPSGGANCEKCGSDLKVCSKYRCSSLGQACDLINEGTGQEKCFWNNKNDVNAPKISPWGEILSPGFKYEEISGGVKIRTDKGECIQAYTPLLFGIKTDELSQCKFDIVNNEYDNMQDYLGSDNLYRTNHIMAFSMPSIEAIANETGLNYTYVLDKIGNIKFYVKCQDKNGNKNINPYLIDICVSPGPDRTAPMILGVNPPTNSYVKFNSTQQPITLYVNEPAQCKWSLFDKGYENMENNMSCITGLQQASLMGLTCSANLPLNLSLSKFYFRCKDQPWKNESSRNTNQQSYVYNLQKSNSGLKIDKIEPNGTITLGVEPASVTLKAYTSGGAENGKATCDYRFSDDGSWIEFFNTFSNEHSQEFTQMLSGLHIIYIECKDAAGNIADGQTKFKLIIDTKTPEIIRVYNSAGLKIITDEDAECVYGENCNFVWENATKMTGSQKEHTTTWENGKVYYVKCRDNFGNKPDSCFIVKTY